jgi:hypothetical protein
MCFEGEDDPLAQRSIVNPGYEIAAPVPGPTTPSTVMIGLSAVSLHSGHPE